MCFLQKTALNLVKYGLQRPNYDLPLHIGGRHSVLYFIIPATEKYSTAMYYIIISLMIRIMIIKIIAEKMTDNVKNKVWAIITAHFTENWGFYTLLTR